MPYFFILKSSIIFTYIPNQNHVISKFNTPILIYLLETRIVEVSIVKPKSKEIVLL